MSETSPTTTPNTEPISSEEAEKRLDALLVLDEEIMKYLLVRRATILTDGSYEINAIHSMRCAIMNFAYYSKYPVEGIDPYKAALDAVLHDFPEGRANDVATLTAGEQTLAQKVVDEEIAMKELWEVLGPLWPELMRALQTYEDQDLRRTRAVRLEDKIDPGYTHLNNYGETLRALGIHSPKVMAIHDARLSERFTDHRSENPDLAEILDAMRRRVAKVAFNGWEQLMIQFDE